MPAVLIMKSKCDPRNYFHDADVLIKKGSTKSYEFSYTINRWLRYMFSIPAYSYMTLTP